MMGYMYEFELRVAVDGSAPSDRDEFSAILDNVTEALVDLNVVDPFLTSHLTDGVVKVRFGSTTDDHADDFTALQLAIGTLRSALHSAGMSTHDWERLTWRLDSARPAGDLVDADA